MGIGMTRYHADVNATNYQDYWESAVSPPPENATSVCVCLRANHFDVIGFRGSVLSPANFKEELSAPREAPEWISFPGKLLNGLINRLNYL